MAHPTRRFFCYRENDEYKMVPCGWDKNPRPMDLEGSHPFYENEFKIVLRFYDDDVLTNLGRDFDKVVLETWTAPDCISDKKQMGQWVSMGVMILKNVQYLKTESIDFDCFALHFRYDSISYTNNIEQVQLSVDHIPEDNWFGMRPGLSPEAIIAYRNEPRGFAI